MTRIIKNLSEISEKYQALFVDLWGCLHNGVTAFPAAIEALRVYRATGGTVILLTNSPRPHQEVARQLKSFGVPDDAWDSIASSGDSARNALFQGAVGHKVWFMGGAADLPFFEPPTLLDSPLEISRVSLAEAEGIVCCGPFDGQADPSVMQPEFLEAKARGLKLLCANPDIIVDRGEKREWCAGALARFYTELGGESLYFGKPHAPIYELARRRLAEVAPDTSDSAILAIGDGPHTDILGAMDSRIDSLFITGGLAAKETGTQDDPDPAALAAYLRQEEIAPTYSLGFLR